jgi:hypothetical protein
MAGHEWCIFTNRYPLVIFNDGSNRCHNVTCLPRLLGIGVALIRGCFFLPNGFDDPVSLANGQGLVTVCRIHQQFISSRFIFGPGKDGTKTLHLRHTVQTGWGGGE